MNYRQKAYDRYDNANFNLKIKNSYYHFKNIQKILYRKPEYKPMQMANSPPKLRINQSPYRNYFVIRENELYKKLLKDIQSTKVKPKMNNFYQTREEKLREYKRQNKTLQNRQLSKENINYKKRLRSQKSMLRIREMDKEYKVIHQKLLDKTRKIKDNKTIILPTINTIMNRINSPKRYNYINSYGSYSIKDGESLHQGKNQSHEPKIKITD